MQGLEREMGLLSEMAFGARNLQEFEAQWLELLRPSLGFETACSVWTDSTGSVLSANSIGYDERLLRARFPLYMGELSTEEVARFSKEQPAIDTDVVSSRRRERLTVYRELLAPIHVSSFITNVWRSRCGVVGFHFARARHTRTFSERDATFLAGLAPCIKLGQALHATEQRLHASGAAGDWWVSTWCLSPREAEVARLLARGFYNPEIAQLLRLSRNTVRNHLASVFRKAEVSTRAELVFAMTQLPVRGRLAPRASRRGAWQAFVTSRG